MTEAAIDAIELCPSDVEQIRRVMVLLDLAEKAETREIQYPLQIGALHLACAIPEHWYGAADHIPIAFDLKGKDADEMKRRLRAEFEAIFETARRYALVTMLRSMDFHFEPIYDPFAFGENETRGRGRPLKIATAPVPGAWIAYFGNNEVVGSSGSKRIGRSEYYQIQKRRFVDSAASQLVPLQIAIREFTDDMPGCIAKIMKLPDVVKWIQDH